MLNSPFRRLAALQGWRAALAACALGLLSALALPPLHAIPVLLLAVPGFLALLGGARSWRRAGVLGFLFGWSHQLVGLYWITEAILIEADRFWWLVPLAVPLLAILMGAYVIIPALAAWFAKPGWPRLLAFAGAWVASEMLRGWLFTGFPWNLLGSVWAFGALPVQGAAVIGVHGLSLVTVILAGLPGLGSRRALLGGGVVLAGFAGFGAWRLAQPGPPDQPWRVVLVQGNVAQEAKWREEARLPTFRRYVDMTQQAEATPPPPETPHSVVLWPETASPFLLDEDPGAQGMAASALRPGDMLLAGSVRVERGQTGRVAAVFNSLVALDSAGHPLGTYDKSYLVPFGEFMPGRGLLPVRIVQSNIDFTAGPGPRTLSVDGLPPFAALICYEVIFPSEVVQPGTRPSWIVNITNDAWFGTSTGPYQHLAAVRLRAVEEGLPVARAAQTGISAVFDARGRELVRLPLGVQATVARTLPGAEPPTPIARYGRTIPGIMLLLTLALAGLGSRPRREVLA